MKNELSNKILERIDENNITPLPRWRFVLLSYVFWLTAFFSVIIGSFAVGAILFLFFDYNQHNLIEIPNCITEFLIMIPYLWIIIFLFFIGIARLSIEYTKKGYRYKIQSVVIISVLLSIIFGSILNLIGVSQIADESLDKFSIYNRLTYDVKDVYTRPIIGRLGGIILLIKDNNNFSVEDFDGRVWQVHLATSTFGFIPELNSTVSMFGVLEASSSIFLVKSIQEWE